MTHLNYNLVMRAHYLNYLVMNQLSILARSKIDKLSQRLTSSVSPVDYQWKITFVLNGAKCNKRFATGGWLVRKLSPKGGKPRVQFTLEFTRRRYQDYWRVFDFAEKKVNKILDAMAPRLFYNLGHPYFPVVSNFELILKNEAQLRAAGKKVPPHSVLRFKYKLVIAPAGLQATLQYNSQIAKSSNDKILRHALHLYRRGLSYEDDFDKFFTLWRSFNALYGHFYKKGSEPQRISQILQRLASNDIAYLITTYSKVSSKSELAIPLAGHNYNLFKYLVSRNLIDNQKRNRSQELGKAISTAQQADILEKAVICLYVVRCNFAHGSNSQVVKDEILFRVSATFLAALLMCLVSKLI